VGGDLTVREADVLSPGPPPAPVAELPWRPSPRWVVVAVLCAVLAFSNAFGRAEPSGRYRPDLPPAALETGCYPLPAGVELGFPHQVRSDGDIDGRRRLVLHYDLMGEDEARTALVAAFTEQGFRERPAGGPDHVALTGPGGVRVTARLTPFDVPDDNVVRGEIVLDLPVTTLASDTATCAEESTTKRFGGPVGAGG
jgi:hypothetical protein